MTHLVRLQDAFVVKEGMGGSNTCFFAVFDGHGSDGAKVSRHLANTMPRLIASSEEFRVRPICRTAAWTGRRYSLKRLFSTRHEA